MAENSLSSNLKSQFHQIASQAGWPEEVIQEIEIQASEEDGSINMSYPPSMKDQVEDLEYGKFEIPPKAAMRKFARASEGELTDAVIDNTLEETIFSKGLL